MKSLTIGLLIAASSLYTAANAQGNCFDPGSYRSSDPAAEANFQRGVQYYNQKQYAAAHQYLGLAAQANHPRAQELMGQIYMFGYGVPVNTQEGFRYMNAAAMQGHRGAISDLGFYYSQITVDLAKADQYFLVAAHCGNIDSQVELAFNYEFGRGVAPNRQQAIYWLSVAAPHWGQAHFVLDWLSRPETPHFQNIDQLSNYISAKLQRAIYLSTPHGTGGPKPFTPSCYQSVSYACVGDPSSLAYRRAHGQ
jgi:TPR repeat protein